MPSPDNPSDYPFPRRLRRLHRGWRDRAGNISYLLTLCVEDRIPVLNNEVTFDRFVAFLLDSPNRYQWFGRRFVIMPDHIHIIARMGNSADVGGSPSGTVSHTFTRIPRSWRWQKGFHDHKFRTPESETRKWEYVCLNPVRYGLVRRPEDWPFGGEIFYDDAPSPCLIRGTPPLLECGILVQQDGTPMPAAPGEGTRPTT